MTSIKRGCITLKMQIRLRVKLFLDLDWLLRGTFDWLLRGTFDWLLRGTFVNF